MHDNIRPGDTIEIGVPRNNFELEAGAENTLLIAGGIGITPLLAMAHSLQAEGKRFEMHVCARNTEAVPFRDELSDAEFADVVSIYLDDADPAERFSARDVLGPYAPGQRVYLCGPSAFMGMIVEAARDLGWPEDAICSETFAPPKVDVSENRPFEVHLARTGKTLQVPADKFLIDVLHENKCPVMCSCTQGICGSCISPVLDGEPEHRDAILTEAERAANDRMCVCVSRAKGDRLVLDI